MNIIAIDDTERTIATVGEDQSDGGGSVNAAVSANVDDDTRAVTLTVTDTEGADTFVPRGCGVESTEIELEPRRPATRRP